MLEPRHIVRLKIPAERIAAHAQLPPPEHVTKALIAQFATLSDAVLTSLMNITPIQFGGQLEAARKCGVELMRETRDAKLVGLSATTSLIKTGNLITKHLIVPYDFLAYDRKLSDHLMIGAFVQGKVENGKLRCDGTVDVAGWVTSGDVRRLQSFKNPPMFQSKLKVIMVPCSALRPISSLFEQVDVTTPIV